MEILKSLRIYSNLPQSIKRQERKREREEVKKQEEKVSRCHRRNESKACKETLVSAVENGIRSADPLSLSSAATRTDRGKEEQRMTFGINRFIYEPRGTFAYTKSFRFVKPIFISAVIDLDSRSRVCARAQATPPFVPSSGSRFEDKNAKSSIHPAGASLPQFTDPHMLSSLVPLSPLLSFSSSSSSSASSAVASSSSSLPYPGAFIVHPTACMHARDP